MSKLGDSRVLAGLKVETQHRGGGPLYLRHWTGWYDHDKLSNNETRHPNGPNFLWLGLCVRTLSSSRGFVSDTVYLAITAQTTRAALRLPLLSSPCFGDRPRQIRWRCSSANEPHGRLPLTATRRHRLFSLPTSKWFRDQNATTHNLLNLFLNGRPCITYTP